jgi:hypothetical protein
VGIVIEVKPKIEEGARDRRTVDGEPGLIHVPASGSRRSRYQMLQRQIVQWTNRTIRMQGLSESM